MTHPISQRHTKPRPGDIAVFFFTAAYLLPATAIAIWQVNTEFMFYVVVMFALVGIIGGIHLRVHFSSSLLFALSVWGLLHMAGGLVPVPASWPINGDIRVLYSLWIIPGYLKYDQVVHAYGFGVTAWACWQSLRWIIARKCFPDAEDKLDCLRIRPTAGMLVLCGAAAMGFGALNEVVEFIATLTMPETNVGGYVNTGYDLVANMVGAATACIAIRLTCNRTNAEHLRSATK